MQTPNPDTSEYAALIEFIATGGRYSTSLKREQDAGAVVRHALARRATAMTQSVLAIAGAVLQLRKY